MGHVPTRSPIYSLSHTGMVFTHLVVGKGNPVYLWTCIKLSMERHWANILERPPLSITRDLLLYHRDDALVYIAYVMLIWAAPIPADRWHCSLWP